MTRKHFAALALALHRLRPAGRSPSAEYTLWWDVVCTTADVCEESNGRFNRHLFISVAENGV